MSNRLFSVSIVAGIALALAAPAGAELEEIKITAQKRESTLQKTNISILTLDAGDLDARGVTQIPDLTQFVPNMNIQPNSNGNGFFVSSRGIGQGDATNITRDPATAIYIDGVYWGITIGNLLDVIDIERVEALRGPQGDLYGRNAVAGAINIITRKPSGGMGGSTSLRAGLYRRGDLRSYLEFPLLEGDYGHYSGNISAATINRDAFYPNEVDQDIESQKRIAFRTALRGEDTLGIAGLTADIVVDYSFSDEESTQMQLTGVTNTPAFFLAAHPAQLALLPAAVGTTADNTSRNTNLNLDGPSARGFGLPGDTTENVGASLTLSYPLADPPLFEKVELKSILGYRGVWSDVYTDLDGTSTDIFSTRNNDQKWQLTWEGSANTTLETDFGSADWLVGVFIFHEEGEGRSQQSTDGTPFGDGGSNSALDTFPDIENDAYAVYSHLALVPAILEDRIKGEFGVRYTFEDRKIDQFAILPGGGTFTGSASQDFDEVTFTGRLSVEVLRGLDLGEFELVDNLNIYGSVAQGFLSGGFNGRSVADGTGTLEDLSSFYRPETLTSYEGGLKMRGFDKRVQLNFAGFFIDYTDLQRTAIFFRPDFSIASGVQNADEAEVYGIEVELTANPWDQILINVGYGLAMTDYKLFCDFDLSGTLPLGGPCPANQTDFSDSRNFANTPEHNVTVGAQQTIPVSFGNVTARVDYYWQSETLLQNGNNPRAGEDDYGILNARLSAHDIVLPNNAGELDVAIWGRNLTDTEYRPFGIDFSRYIVQMFGPRRTYGIDVTWRFGSLL